jgi:branched-chain amino acid aminotransferase
MLELLTGASIDLATSGARHGVGLFETLRVRHGVPLRLEAHLERLTQGTRFLGLAAPPDADCVRAFLETRTLCRTLPDGILRLVAVDGQLHVTVAPWEPGPAGPVQVAVSLRWRRFSGSPLNRFKTLSYLENRLLAGEAQERGLFDVIAPNEAGRLTDGSRTTLFAAIQGELLTPPVTEGVLPGVARRVLLEAGLAREAPLAFGALEEAQALLLTNSLRGALPVDRCGARTLDPGHALLGQAARILEGSPTPSKGSCDWDGLD